MSWAFVSLALAMLAAAGLFALWPLWRPLPEGVGVADDGMPPSRGKHAALGLVALLSVFAMGVYSAVGRPQAWLQPELLAAAAETDQPTPASVAQTESEAAPNDAPAAEAGSATAGVGPAQIEAMVQRLAQRLQTAPNDAAGWRMLARSYETLRRFDDAAAAYQRLVALEKPDADLLVDYAVALGMSKGQTLRGEPEALLTQALNLQPGHSQALALSGSAAFERHDYQVAITHWQSLLTHVPADADMRASIQANIDKAKSLQAAGR